MDLSDSPLTQAGLSATLIVNCLTKMLEAAEANDSDKFIEYLKKLRAHRDSLAKNRENYKEWKLSEPGTHRQQ